METRLILFVQSAWVIFFLLRFIFLDKPFCDPYRSNIHQRVGGKTNSLVVVWKHSVVHFYPARSHNSCLIEQNLLLLPPLKNWHLCLLVFSSSDCSDVLGIFLKGACYTVLLLTAQRTQSCASVSSQDEMFQHLFSSLACDLLFIWFLKLFIPLDFLAES